MADIFLSYSSEDRERVMPLVKRFDSAGYSVWWDRSIGIGASFDREIERELDASSCVVVVWSKFSIKSDWVRNEASDGYERDVLVPLRIDDVRPPLEFRRAQTADLVDWLGEVDASGLALVIASVQSLVGSRTPRPANGSESQNEDHRSRIVVLPFLNRSLDPEHDLLADGIAEDIALCLTAFREISVVPPSATYRFKEHTVDSLSVGSQLDADYTLEGSVRVASDRIRVVAQLTSIQTRELVWSQSFDRALVPEAIFELQDEINEHISATIADSYGIIRSLDLKQIRRVPPETMTAYQAVLLAQAFLRDGLDSSQHKNALTALQETTKREPGYADGWAWLGAMYRDDPSISHREKNLERAKGAAKSAIEIDSSNQEALIVLAAVHYLKGEVDLFKQISSRALALNPSSTDLHLALGLLFAYAGLDDALEHSVQAIDLHPDPPAIMFISLLLHHTRKGEDTQAVDVAKNGLSRVISTSSWSNEILLTGLTAALGQLGEVDEAMEYYVRLRDECNWSPTKMRISQRYSNFCSELCTRLEDGLRKAGIEITPEDQS